MHAATRYPLGYVATGDYETVRADLTRRLRTFVNERNQAVFSQVDRREDVYRGSYVDQAPDILASCAPAFEAIYGSLARDLRAHTVFGPFDELGFTGTHDPRGLYLFTEA